MVRLCHFSIYEICMLIGRPTTANYLGLQRQHYLQELTKSLHRLYWHFFSNRIGHTTFSVNPNSLKWGLWGGLWWMLEGEKWSLSCPATRQRPDSEFWTYIELGTDLSRKSVTCTDYPCGRTCCEIASETSFTEIPMSMTSGLLTISL